MSNSECFYDRLKKLGEAAKELDLDFDIIEVMNKSEVLPLEEGEADSEVAEVYILDNKKTS